MYFHVAFELVRVFNMVDVYLYQIPKMLRSLNNNADQQSNQFVTSLCSKVIPAKIVQVVDCMRAIGLSIE